MELIRPRRLRAGDRIAAVTLSWGGPGTFPHRYEAGKRQLQEAFDVEVVEMPHTLADPRSLAADPAARADDLHRAFADPEIAGVVSSIGGDDSIRLLPHLDLELLRRNAKPFLGYSDTTVTQMALLRAGVTSFYGPAVMAGFGENAGLHGYLVEGVRQVLFEDATPLAWPPNTEGWTVEMLDWADPAGQERQRTLQPSTGWRWYGGTPREGRSVVGCVDVLMWLRGTDWWPDLTDAVLCLETSEEAPPPDLLTRFLRSLAISGELERLGAIVLGRPGGTDLSPEDRAAYDEAVLGVVRREAEMPGLPVVCNVDFGHTDPMWTIPQGVRVRVDPTEGTITFLGSGVS